jgi:RNA recognition motif-containing protein
MAAKLFVGNLDFKTTRADLEALFAQLGALREVFLPLDRESGQPRGFAFVEYEAEEAAARAIERFDGYELGGRALRVNPATDRPAGGRVPTSRGFGADAPRSGPPRGGFGGGKPKGSRRNVRAKKRSL